ncbi:MAG: transposase family protein [Oscillospiraceae bacterium]|nr:transposase family protein [Oscillospiraceae bacterium]
MKMVYIETTKLTERQFRRLNGVNRYTFEKMSEILKKAQIEKKKKGGRANKLSVEDMLMLSLEYWREERTYFQIGSDYGISESYVYKIIRWVKNTLTKNGAFDRVLRLSRKSKRVKRIKSDNSPDSEKYLKNPKI